MPIWSGGIRIEREKHEESENNQHSGRSKVEAIGLNYL